MIHVMCIEWHGGTDSGTCGCVQGYYGSCTGVYTGVCKAQGQKMRLSDGGLIRFGNPYRAQLSQFELFELYPLIEIRETSLYRAIRGASISMYTTLPPS